MKKLSSRVRRDLITGLFIPYRLIVPARRQWLGVRLDNADDLLFGLVHVDLHTRAAVTVVTVGLDPLRGLEVGPIAVRLVAALNGNDPLAVAVD